MTRPKRFKVDRPDGGVVAGFLLMTWVTAMLCHHVGFWWPMLFTAPIWLAMLAETTTRTMRYRRRHERELVRWQNREW